ncbi:hypothetical protein PPERSA_03829 [Pseudocohnilembus persalinus]|uniref:C3H1-type domain-containing protein n=1 Tax=Pseudocohnilembus persalinus TaxID=266149 RepID=A0A0V0QUJ9_PSEPJ|nr:hypothetical protein PPERSA_03829 [Pseudocohnilembus persalinus]|eukprot:KRX05892.1 hypothetical protein PPERSA_03829 [Pseudocohnilembus persalinus]
MNHNKNLSQILTDHTDYINRKNQKMCSYQKNNTSNSYGTYKHNNYSEKAPNHNPKHYNNNNNNKFTKQNHNTNTNRKFSETQNNSYKKPQSQFQKSQYHSQKSFINHSQKPKKFYNNNNNQHNYKQQPQSNTQNTNSNNNYDNYNNNYNNNNYQQKIIYQPKNTQKETNFQIDQSAQKTEENVSTRSPSTDVNDKSPQKKKSTDETKFKTEMCKNFEETGKCNYGKKCKFAHGKNELMGKQAIDYQKYRSKPCQTFHSIFYCPYGQRCMFKHDDRSIEQIKKSYFYQRKLANYSYDIQSKLHSQNGLACNNLSIDFQRLPIFINIQRNYQIQQLNEQIYLKEGNISDFMQDNKNINQIDNKQVQNFNILQYQQSYKQAQQSYCQGQQEQLEQQSYQSQQKNEQSMIRQQQNIYQYFQKSSSIEFNLQQNQCHKNFLYQNKNLSFNNYCKCKYECSCSLSTSLNSIQTISDEYKNADIINNNNQFQLKNQHQNQVQSLNDISQNQENLLFQKQKSTPPQMDFDEIISQEQLFEDQQNQQLFINHQNFSEEIQDQQNQQKQDLQEEIYKFSEQEMESMIHNENNWEKQQEEYQMESFYN